MILCIYRATSCDPIIFKKEKKAGRQIDKMPKSPFEVPTRRIKQKDRCNFIKSDGKRCRCYHKKQSLFCANHQAGTELVFNKKGETEMIICHHKSEKKGKYTYKRYLTDISARIMIPQTII